VINAGSVEEIDAAFRRGSGDYVHQQGPAPQQLENWVNYLDKLAACRTSVEFARSISGRRTPPASIIYSRL